MLSVQRYTKEVDELSFSKFFISTGHGASILQVSFMKIRQYLFGSLGMGSEDFV